MIVRKLRIWGDSFFHTHIYFLHPLLLRRVCFAHRDLHEAVPSSVYAFLCHWHWSYLPHLLICLLPCCTVLSLIELPFVFWLWNEHTSIIKKVRKMSDKSQLISFFYLCPLEITLLFHSKPCCGSPPCSPSSCPGCLSCVFCHSSLLVSWTLQASSGPLHYLSLCLGVLPDIPLAQTLNSLPFSLFKTFLDHLFKISTYPLTLHSFALLIFSMTLPIIWHAVYSTYCSFLPYLWLPPFIRW